MMRMKFPKHNAEADDEAVMDVEVDAEAEAAPEPPKEMTVFDALKEVLKTALVHDGLARGLHEAAKALDKRQAHLCVLAKNCDNKDYSKLVEALCAHHQINLMKVEDKLTLGEWAGLCKIDKEGQARKIVGCSCVVVKDYGEEGAALDMILDYFKNAKAEE
jgi:small subunit ribosomal protein S12e